MPHPVDKWTELLENGGHTDLDKAFDKIPHKRLISKLSSYGLNIEIVSWIEAFILSVRLYGKAVCLSVRLSVRNAPVSDKNALTYCHSLFI